MVPLTGHDAPAMPAGLPFAAAAAADMAGQTITSRRGRIDAQIGLFGAVEEPAGRVTEP